MGSISVSNDFSTFCTNLRLQESTVTNIKNRYHAITKRINQDFWGSDSDKKHSIYVGSYGRGTCVYTSDIDIVVEQLENLDDNIVVNRITGDAKVDDLIEPIWTLKKVVVLNDIDKMLKFRNTYQGINLKKAVLK